MISFIDKEILFKNKNIVQFNDSGFMKKLNEEGGYSK